MGSVETSCSPKMSYSQSVGPHVNRVILAVLDEGKALECLVEKLLRRRDVLSSQLLLAVTRTMTIVRDCGHGYGHPRGFQALSP